MTIVRSTEAHALINAIDSSDAVAVRGVVSVVTGADLSGTVDVMARPGVDVTLGAEHPLLAGDRVMYIGQPIALVIAETLAVAEDAAELVDVRYDPLPAVTNASHLGERQEPAPPSPERQRGTTHARAVRRPRRGIREG
jgi:CO/xanthine dehydrogenase Mo-binding subunit